MKYLKKYDNAEVKISNEMSLIRYPTDLKMYEKKLLIAILSKFSSVIHTAQMSGIEEPVREIRMSREELNKFLNIDTATFNKRYNPKQLVGMSAEKVPSSTAYKLIHGFGIYKESPKEVGSGVLFDTIKYNLDDNEIYVHIGELGVELLNIKNKDGNYYYYKIVQIYKLSLPTAQRLYELLIQYNDTRFRKMNFERYKFLMGWENTRTDNVMAGTEKAMEELKKYQMFPGLKMKTKKGKSGKIQTITFSWRDISEITSDREPIMAKPLLSDTTLNAEWKMLEDELDDAPLYKGYELIQDWLTKGARWNKTVAQKVEKYVWDVINTTDREEMWDCNFPEDFDINDATDTELHHELLKTLLAPVQYDEAVEREWFKFAYKEAREDELLDRQYNFNKNILKILNVVQEVAGQKAAKKVADKLLKQTDISVLMILNAVQEVAGQKVADEVTDELLKQGWEIK